MSLFQRFPTLCRQVFSDGISTDVTDSLLAAKSAIRLAQGRCARAITVAWVENNEITGDQAVVREALAR